MKVSRGNALWVGVILVVIATLLVQDQRHGWPFSRHHSMQTSAAHREQRVHNSSPTSAAERVPIELSAQQVEQLGVSFEPVSIQPLANPVRAVATVAADESRITHVHSRVAGWLEQLYVSTTGQAVRIGQPLAGIFSQELYSSQAEYLSALQRAGSGPSSAVVAAARQRLKVLGMNESEIESIEKSREPRRLITITASASGIVLERGVSAGTAIDPSTDIVTLADLSRIWVIAEVAEADAMNVREGSTASLTFPTSGRGPFNARVEFVYPTLTERTRSVRVRLPVANKNGELRPGMYGTAEFPPVPRDALLVPRDAVVDTGESQHVFVHDPSDAIEPRQVKIGARVGERIEVLEGLSPGDHVVTTGVFLIDSESRLRASGGAAHSGHGTKTTPAERSEDQPTQHDH